MRNQLSALHRGNCVRLKFNGLIGTVAEDERPDRPVVVQFPHGDRMQHNRSSLRKLTLNRRKEQAT